MGRANGSRVTLAGQWARLVVQAVAFVILSRLLTPADFGIAAMVTAVLVFASLLADSGLSLAGLQIRDVTPGQQSNLFWLNTAAGLVAMALVVVSGPVLAWFYGEPVLVGLSSAISVTLLLNGLAAQFRVLLNRKLRFGALALQDILSAVFGLVAGVGTALLGFGYWAIAAQTITQAATALIIAVSQARWRPGLPRRNQRMGRVVAFGAQNLGLQMSNLASRTVDVFAVGRGIGAEPLGVYIRANQMVSLVFQQLLAPLTRVVIPMLTAEKGIARINASLLHLQLGISYSMFAALSLLAVLASPFVPVILGKEWAAMGPVVQIVCIGAAFQALGYIYYWAFLALQRSDLLLISELPGRIVMMLGSVSVVSLGIEVVAGVMSAGLLIIWITGTLFFAPRLGIDVRGLVRTGMRPLLLFGGAAGLPIALRASGWPPAAGYGIAPSLVGLGAWLGVLGLGLLLPWVRSDVAEAFSMLRRG